MKLSIITINYNDALGLQRTLDSVACQIILSSASSFSLEHIIIDGASTDGSVDVIRNYEKSLTNIGGALANIGVSLKWVSEKDKGVYNAMNKGIRLASGDYIQILNSGDILASNDVIARMHTELLRISSLNCSDNGVSCSAAAQASSELPDILYGNMLKRTPEGKTIGKSGAVPYSLLNYFTSTMNHDCCWIKRSLFNTPLNCSDNGVSCSAAAQASSKLSYGLYDENLKIVSDWKWFLQAIGLGHVRPVYVDIDVTIFDTTGISERNLELRNQERRKVLEELLPPAILADYDRHAFDMHQMDNLRRHPWAYKFVWTLERILNRLDNKNFKKPKK